MKQTFKYVGMALICAIAVISCAREVLPEIDKPEEVSIDTPKTHTILIKAVNDADTRTYIGTDNTSSLWSVGDRVLVYQEYEYDDGKTSGWMTELRESEDGITEDGGQTMIFPVTFDAVDPEFACDFTYRALYSGKNVSFNRDSWVLSAYPPRTQYPTATSFDPDADLLVSREVYFSDAQPSELNLEFRRFTALGQMTLVGAPADLPDGAKIQSVQFGARVPLIRRLIMSSYEDTYDQWEEDGSLYSNDVLMRYDGKDLSPVGLKAQFMCSPCVVEDGFYVIVIVEAGGALYGYAKEVALSDGQALMFEAGKATVFSVNMSEMELIPLPAFEFEFTEETLEEFPELVENRLDIPFAVGGGESGEKPKKSKEAGDYINLYFTSSHPCSVSFSEPWLSATPSDGINGYFNLYATLNDTGAPREATMTISSDWGGEPIVITVVQATMVLPTAITINASATTVTPYTCFDIEASLVYPEGETGDFYPDVYLTDGSSNVTWSSTGRYLAINPGTVCFHAEFSYGEYYLESESIEVTITEGTAPTDWYFLVNRETGAFLVHRTGSGDTDIQLSELSTSVANGLAFSSDRSKVYVVGSVKVTDDNDNVVEEPRLWTVSNGESTYTKLNLTSGRGMKVAVDGEDIYVLANGSAGYAVLKNNESVWSRSSDYNIFDLAVENGNYYISGATPFENWATGNTPYLWTNGGSTVLDVYVDSDLYQQRYFPVHVSVKDGEVYVSGYVMARDRYSHDHAVMTLWEGDDSYFPYRSRGDWWWSCVYDMALLDSGDRIYIGESFYNSSSNRQQLPAFYKNLTSYTTIDSSNLLPLNYSGEVCLNEIHLCNGIPVMRGTVDSSPAFWEAPWKDPLIWENTDDTVVGFLVK